MLPRPVAPTIGPKKGLVVVTVLYSQGGGNPIPIGTFQKLFVTRKLRPPKRFRPVFDPEAPTMGPWA